MDAKMHYVQRAIIMAAGTGNRMMPITKDVPKPLVEVNGMRMIDSVIDALHKNGIADIYVVVGYLKEKFYKWSQKYDHVNILENPQYNVCNNISSLYAARRLLDKDCIILDADQIINNPEVLKREFDSSGYSASWCEKPTNEWLLQTQENKIISCSRNGGSEGWRLYSVSRWTKEDAQKLSHYVAEEFERGNRQIYWDDVPVFLHNSQFDLEIVKIHEGDIEEIDSLQELSMKDPKYRAYLSES